jgi:hypothetical protein
MRAIPAFLAFSLLAGPVLAEEAAAPAAAPAPVAAPAPAAEVPAAAPAVATEGMLSVASTVPGTVFVDDKDTGLTTPVTNFAVAAGAHVVKVVTTDGRSVSSDFTIEAGGSLNLNLTVPEAAPAAAPAATETPVVAPAAAAAPAAMDAAPPAQDWTWMTVAGWGGLGLGTIGLLSGAVVLTTPTDPQQTPLGFGLFGTGVGFVLGGAVLLYLDSELASAPASVTAAPAR